MDAVKAGFPFMFGIYGTTATRETVSLLKDTGAASVLLLARNIESPAQTRRLIRELQDKVGRPILFAVDHEGGWVLRFSSGVTAFPGNAALGRAKDPALARETGRRMAEELAALGIGLNLAPVLDVVGHDYNPGIGIRSFGSEPKLVARLGAAFIQGQQAAGVAACAKHFPGKGAARQDSHVTLPTIKMEEKRFNSTHLAPFKAAIDAKVECVMTSHVFFPALDRRKRPATFSRLITRDILRERLDFRGVVISDDLCMGAITETWPLQQASIEALAAGHDLLIIAHDANSQRESAELVEQALEQDLIDENRFQASVLRVEALVDRYARPESAAPRPKAAALLSRSVAEKAVRVVNKGAVRLPIPADRKVAFLWPDFDEAADRFTFEGGTKGALRSAKKAASRWKKASWTLTPVVKEDARAAERALESAENADVAVFFCFEAMRFPGQKQTLQFLNAACPQKLVLCLIRNPWDCGLARPETTVVDSASYRSASIEALLKALG